jgi:hypothetical protein
MRLFCAGVVLLGLAGAPVGAAAQALNCRHTAFESPEARQSREDARAAMTLIHRLLDQSRPGAFPTWEQLASSPALMAMRSDGGRLGELARTIQWGSAFPLPDWRIHYIAQREAYAYSLVDTADPCGLTYFSNDTGAIVEGYPVTTRRPGVMPIT